MINEKNVKRYCCEDISLIENYQDAINDKEQTWDCHHRLETDLGLSTQELNDSNRYWKVEAKYLIFLTPSEHHRIHSSLLKGENNPKYGKPSWNSGKHNIYSEDTLQKMSKSLKGKSAWNKGINLSENIREKMRVPHPNGHKPLPKYKWKTPNGEIREMSIQNAKNHHPDWILVE